jgi:hypothetical protein
MYVLTAAAVYLQTTKRFAFYFFLAKTESSETEGILRARDTHTQIQKVIESKKKKLWKIYFI